MSSATFRERLNEAEGQIDTTSAQNDNHAHWVMPATIGTLHHCIGPLITFGEAFLVAQHTTQLKEHATPSGSTPVSQNVIPSGTPVSGEKGASIVTGILLPKTKSATRCTDSDYVRNESKPMRGMRSFLRNIKAATTGKMKHKRHGLLRATTTPSEDGQVSTANTIIKMVRNARDPDEASTPTAGDACVGSLRWVAVGNNKRKEHGYLIPTVYGANALKDSLDPKTAANAVNDARAYGIWKTLAGTGVLIDTLIRVCTSEPSDWRPLGLKAALYDCARERTFTQPTGVEWAVAEKAPWLTEHVPTCELQQWAFRSVFVSLRYLEAALRFNNGFIQVAAVQANEPNGVPVGLESWYLDSDNTVLIVLDQATLSTPAAWALWTLVHLQYPLHHTVEAFDVSQLGDADGSWQTFIRNSTLVSLPGRIQRIIFVVTSDSAIAARLGGVEIAFDVGIRFLNNPGPALIWEANPIILGCLDVVLNYTSSLRILFDEYTLDRMIGGGNWLEIDSLVAVLTARYPRKPEAVRVVQDDMDRTRSRLTWTGGPRSVLEAIADNDATTPVHEYMAEVDHWERYGHDDCVTALDQRVATRR